MNTKKLSRTTQVDTDKCVEMSGGNRFDLVIMAAARARELGRQHRNADRTEHIYPAITALLEFQEGKLGPEYIKRVK